MSLSEVDVSALINAIETIQKVDARKLRRQLNTSVSDDLKNEQDSQDDNIGYDESKDPEINYMELKKKYDELKAVQNDLNVEIKKHLETNKHLLNELANIRDELNKKNLTLSEKEGEILQLKVSVESADKNMKVCNQRLKECKDEMKSNEKSLQEMQKEMENVKRATNEELTRLNRLMEQKMSDGNPNITDLSDQNRPSKLVEIYSNLYDYEWTDAFEVLTETLHLEDKKAIELLLKILLESSKHACDVSHSTMAKIEKLLSGSSDGVVPDCKQLLREARKHVDIKKADDFFKDFREKLAGLVERIYFREEKVAVYIKKCFQLCWLMSIQDPLVVLSTIPVTGDKFDTSLYKHYQHSGDTIDYVVWPALLLNKDGPLLAKGVVEPLTKPRAKSATATVRYAAKDDISFDTRSQIKYDDKVRESAPGSHVMYMTRHGNNVPFSTESCYSPVVTTKIPTHDSKYRVHSATPTKPGQSLVPERIQWYEHEVFRSSYDEDRFQRFCKDLFNFQESSLRKMYGSDYERYCQIYLSLKQGHY